MPQSQKAASETGVHVLQLSTADGAEGIIIAVDGFLADGLHRAGLVEDDEVEDLGLGGSVVLFHSVVCFEFQCKVTGRLSQNVVQQTKSQKKPWPLRGRSCW